MRISYWFWTPIEETDYLAIYTNTKLTVFILHLEQPLLAWLELEAVLKLGKFEKENATPKSVLQLYT